MKVLLFDDQTVDHTSILLRLTQVKGNIFLTGFFEQIYAILRSEVASQTHHTRAQIPGFTSISDLVVRYAESGFVSPALDSALTCISQIGCFIR